MKIKDKYQLEFIKRTSLTGEIVFDCIPKDTTDSPWAFQLLWALGNDNALAMRDDLILAIDHGDKNWEGDDWVSDGFEGHPYEVNFQYPNVMLAEYLVIPMTEMKQLLDEWIEFCGFQ